MTNENNTDDEKVIYPNAGTIRKNGTTAFKVMFDNFGMTGKNNPLKNKTD